MYVNYYYYYYYFCYFQVLYIPELNLQLQEDDLPLLQSVIDTNDQQLVDYTAMAANTHRIISYIYSNKPDTKVNTIIIIIKILYIDVV